MENSNRLARVSSLYGPGAVGGWILTLFSVLVSWTVNSHSSTRDTITHDFVATLSLPAIASINLFYQLQRFPGNIHDLLTRKDDVILQSSAAIEAPLIVCETFSVFAIILVGLSTWHGHRKRGLSTIALGLLCYSTEIVLLIGTHSISASAINFARPFVFSTFRIVTFALFLLVLLATPFFVYFLTSPANAPASPTEEHLRRNYAAARWRKQTACMTYAYAVVILLLSGLVGTGQFVKKTVNLADVSLGSQILFFIPRSSSSVWDLDQAVALAGGGVTLGYRVYEAVKCVVAREREDFERWRVASLVRRRRAAGIPHRVVELGAVRRVNGRGAE